MQKYLIAVDAPDPDSLVLMRVAQHMFGEDNIIGVLLTGRPIRHRAMKDTANEDWNFDDSRQALYASAIRFRDFIVVGYKTRPVNIYDGGIAPRTLVPHYIRYKNYYRLSRDDDPLEGISPRYYELQEIEKLAAVIRSDEIDNFSVLVGGPMTGLEILLKRFPGIAEKVTSLHAMYGSLGEIELMDFGDRPRGAKQFNVACDPFAGKYVIDSLKCPIYFIPSESTRDDRIGFLRPADLGEFLESSNGNNHLIKLYEVWFANAIEPRNEIVYVHDVCAAMSASEHGKDIYEFKPMAITRFPTLPQDKDEWGIIEFEPRADSNIFVSTKLKNPDIYLKLLKDHLK